MADTKISALTDASAPASGDLIVIARSGANYKLSWDELIASLPGVDGWVNGTAYTWTYVSATSFKISGVDLTAIFTPGTRIKLTQTTVKYFVVVSSTFSTDTTVTITGGSDYSLANAAISANYYSYADRPRGYPVYFNWVPVWGGFSADPTVSNAVFAVIAAWCFLWLQTSASGTSNATTLTFTAPIATPNVTAIGGATSCIVIDNGVTQTTPGQVIIPANSATVSVRKNFDGGTTLWTNTGSKRPLAVSLNYPIV